MHRSLYVDSTNRVEIKAMPDGSCRMQLRGGWSDDIPGLYKRYNCDWLWLRTGVEPDMLAKVVSLQFAKSVQLLGNIPGTHVLESAFFLDRLMLQLTNAATLDLSRLSLSTLNAKVSLIKDLGALPKSITDLTLMGYDGIDASKVSRLIKLERLGLHRAAKLTNLDGVEGLHSIHELEISYAPHLVDLESVSKLRSLEKISLDHCPHLGSIESFARATQLQAVALNDCGEIASLAPVEHLPLKTLMFIGNTNIADGKIHWVKDHPSFERVGFQNRKHYDTTRELIGLRP